MPGDSIVPGGPLQRIQQRPQATQLGEAEDEAVRSRPQRCLETVD